MAVKKTEKPTSLDSPSYHEFQARLLMMEKLVSDAESELDDAREVVKAAKLVLDERLKELRSFIRDDQKQEELFGGSDDG